MTTTTAQLDPPQPGLLLLLRRFFVLSYLALLLNAGRYLLEIRYDGAFTVLFAAAVLLSYGVVYLFAPAAVCLALARLAEYRLRHGEGRPVGPALATGILALAWMGATAVQILIYTDVFLYRLWGYHFNSYVLNMLATPGGIGSMGTGPSTVRTFFLTAAAIAGIEGILLVLAARARLLVRLLDRLIATPRRRAVLAAAWVVLAGFQALAYGASKLRWYTPTLQAARAFPFYLPVSFSRAGRRMGWEASHVQADLRVRFSGLNYPLKPIVVRKEAPRYNVVFLVCESLRADMVDPEIMPKTCDFATREALWFRRCYSAGDGTRMGMFGLFYGLHGSYWFPALNANRGPVLIDLLLGRNYQFNCRTSQSFTYPEFDRTVFVNVPSANLHVIGSGAPGWQRDRRNVAALLEWLDRRDPNRPFFQFMFYESSHARYFFPPESVIRTPYLEDFNYAELNNIARDPERQRLLKNRYINSCHHLDSQIGRVLDYLRDRGLLGTTVVVLTGDHGEEFWEPDRWGHPADSFHEAHERVPLLLHVPGVPPRRIDRMVSHIDVAPTLLRLLGVENPPGDYCLGIDLLGGRQRDSACVFGWDFMAWIGRDAKITQRYRGPGFAAPEVTTPDDRPLPDDKADEILRRKLPHLVEVLKQMRRFAR